MFFSNSKLDHMPQAKLHYMYYALTRPKRSLSFIPPFMTFCILLLFWFLFVFWVSFKKKSNFFYFQTMGNLGSSDVDSRLEEQLIDGILYAFQEQTQEVITFLFVCLFCFLFCFVLFCFFTPRVTTAQTLHSISLLCQRQVMRTLKT